MMNQGSKSYSLSLLLAITSGATIGALFHFFNRYYSPKTNTFSSKLNLQINKQPQSLRTRRKSSFMENNPQPKFSKEQVASNQLLEQLSFLSRSLCEVQRVQNLILNLGIQKPKKIQNQFKFALSHMLVQPGTFLIQQGRFSSDSQVAMAKRWLRAGARKFQFFQVNEVKALIVVTGDICPGLNNIIRDLTNYYIQSYGINEVYGLNNGFSGINNTWVKLNTNNVKQIHQQGGCILRVGRGKFDLKGILQSLKKNAVTHFIVIGGSGAMKAVLQLQNQILACKLKISISFIPKFPQNQFKFIHSFGSSTVIQYGVKLIDQGYAFASSKNAGIAIIKMSGRKSGYLAVQSALAAGKVDLCLVPQFNFDIYGKHGLLQYIYKKITEKGFIVIVISQGANIACRDYQFNSQEQDQTGNYIPGDLTTILQQLLKEFLENKGMHPHFMKIDGIPIMAMPSNSYDSKLISRITLYNIFAMMSGYTNFAISETGGKLMIIPIQQIEGSPFILTRHNLNWQRLIGLTDQPSLLNLDVTP